MILPIHYQLKQSVSKEQQIEKLLTVATEFWNMLVLTDQLYYQHFGKTPTKKEYSHQVKFLKRSYERFDLLHTHLYQVLISRYFTARDLAFKKFKKTGKLELPHYKNHLIKSLTFKEYGNGCKITGNKVRFNHLNIKFRKHCPIPEDIRNICIKRYESGRYELIVVANVEPVQQETNSNRTLGHYADHKVQQFITEHTGSKVVGADAGVKTLLTLSDGITYRNPKFFNRIGKQIKRLNIKKSKQKKGSNRQKKTKLAIAKQYEKLEQCRTDYLHRVSKDVVQSYDTVVIEQLNVETMLDADKNWKTMNRSIADACMAKLQQFLLYKSLVYQMELLKVPCEYTTQDCSGCGNRVPKELSERMHYCDNCGLTLDRDLNASINIYKAGILPSVKLTEKPSPSKAW